MYERCMHVWKRASSSLSVCALTWAIVQKWPPTDGLDLKVNMMNSHQFSLARYVVVDVGKSDATACFALR